jgi:hypothetical protein
MSASIESSNKTNSQGGAWQRLRVIPWKSEFDESSDKSAKEAVPEWIGTWNFTKANISKTDISTHENNRKFRFENSENDPILLKLFPSKALGKQVVKLEEESFRRIDPNIYRHGFENDKYGRKELETLEKFQNWIGSIEFRKLMFDDKADKYELQPFVTDAISKDRRMELRDLGVTAKPKMTIRVRFDVEPSDTPTQFKIKEKKGIDDQTLTIKDAESVHKELVRNRLYKDTIELYFWVQKYPSFANRILYGVAFRAHTVYLSPVVPKPFEEFIVCTSDEEAGEGSDDIPKLDK